MSIELAVSIAAIALLLLLSAFFSGSETSLTAASRPRMHMLEREGSRRARLVNQLWGRKERLIGAILVGNNAVNISASTLATGVLITWFGEAGVAYATVVMTLLVVIFGEILPKTYALHHADRMALVVGPMMRPVVYVLAPVTHAIQAIVRGVFRLFGIDFNVSLDAAERAEEELRGAIDLHLHHGTREEVRQEREMLRSILDLADVEVGEIMTHRSNVVTIDVGQPPAKVVEDMLASPYTRMPLWRGTPDNIVGVLHAKELFRAVKADPDGIDNIDVMAIAHSPWFIPESTDLLSQLQAFRTRHEHFAIVVDEYGELLGIVTLEDILEEIVGEIADEHDVEMEGVQILKDGAVAVDGSVTIRDLNRRFDWRLPDEEASTIAGLVLYEARRIPEVGQVYLFHGFRFEILGRKRNQITAIKLTPLSDSVRAEENADKPEAETQTGGESKAVAAKDAQIAG